MTDRDVFDTVIISAEKPTDHSNKLIVRVLQNVKLLNFKQKFVDFPIFPCPLSFLIQYYRYLTYCTTNRLCQVLNIFTKNKNRFPNFHETKYCKDFCPVLCHTSTLLLFFLINKRTQFHFKWLKNLWSVFRETKVLFLNRNSNFPNFWRNTTLLHSIDKFTTLKSKTDFCCRDPYSQSAQRSVNESLGQTTATAKKSDFWNSSWELTTSTSKQFDEFFFKKN